MSKYEILIIGGGFYGMYIAEHYAKAGYKVIVCEEGSGFMGRASLVNQARVHNGYHYPRSILTALRSRISFPRFSEEFKDCIHSDFNNYYMVGKQLGKISAKQFELFCKRIGASCEEASPKIKSLVNQKYIENVYETKEWVFDAKKIVEKMELRLNSSGVECRLNTRVESVSKQGNGKIVARIISEGQDEFIECLQVFNCTYSGINKINRQSGLESIRLKHELTEMCLFDVPDELKVLPFFDLIVELIEEDLLKSIEKIFFGSNYKFKRITTPKITR